MFRSIVASQHTQDEWVWIERERQLQSDGNNVIIDTEYEDLDILFMHLPVRQKRENTGYYEKGDAQAIVPEYQLYQRDITPNTHTSFLRNKRTNRLYRVSGFDDYSHLPQNHCYLLILERVELDDVRRTVQLTSV